VLVNAIYFKGKWARQFETNLTENEPFYVSSGKAVTGPTYAFNYAESAPLMRQTGDFGYAELPDLQVLELPYAGDDLSMIVLLPREVDGLGNLEAGLTAENLTAWTASLKSQKVNVLLPKFKMTAEFSLKDTLMALGMSDAFNFDRADFSGMDGRKDLFVEAVIHKAFVEVNEEGTEAAAATAVLMDFAAVVQHPQPIPVFRADHPFLFLIRDNRSGSILFLGRVMDPTK
jgi:serpin B